MHVLAQSPAPSSVPPHAFEMRRATRVPRSLVGNGLQRCNEADVAVTRSWGGAGSSAQPRLRQAGTPPGTTTTAGTRVTPNRRNRRGSMATPASAPPRRSPITFAVSGNPPAPTPRSTSGAPVRAASRAHCRQLAAGTDRLVKIRISAVPERGPERSPAWRSAGRGADSPDRPGRVCRAASPARSRARSTIERVHAPSDSPSLPPALRRTSSTRRAASASEAGVRGNSSARSVPNQPAASSRAVRNRVIGVGINRVIGPFRYCRLSLCFKGFTGGSSCVSSTAGTRNSRPRPAVRAASPTRPRSARSGCSR